MMVSVFIAMSLDGFIARENGSIDWLEKFNKTAPKDEDCGYTEFSKSIDVMVMGKNTFKKVLSFTPWPYSVPVYVLTTTGVDIPERLANRVFSTSEDPKKLYLKLKKKGYQHLYTDGGITIQGFLRSGLVDEMTISTIPVILGSGSRLFGALNSEIDLVHQSTVSYPFGLVQTKYLVSNSQ